MIEFSDFNFKLCVIQELMYDKEILQPAFDAHEFAENHAARAIDIDEEGYDVIAECKTFFEELELTPELLAQVKEITLSLGGQTIAHQIIPFWDGEDDVFNVAATAEDFAHLPNLEVVFDDVGILEDDIQSLLTERGVRIK